MPSPSSACQPINKRKYHTASTFYLFCKQFIDESAASGRQFRTESQGVEAAALRWNSFTKEEQEEFRRVFKEERRLADENEIRRFKIRNGSRRDSEYDPVSLGLLKNLSLKDDKDAASLQQRWNWSYYGKEIGIQTERFMIVSVASPSIAAANIGEFNTLAVVEFSLKEGIVQEFSVNVDNVICGSQKARQVAVQRVLGWPAKSGRTLGDATPTFYAPPGQLEAVFNALINVGDGTVASDAEKKFSLLRDLASMDVLVGAMEKWFGRRAVEPIDTADSTESLGIGRGAVERILLSFRN